MERNPRTMVRLVEEALFLHLVDQLLVRHPWPWKAERDWTYEVVASDATVIAKCREPQEAQDIVDFAEKRKAYLDSLPATIEDEKRS